MASLNLSLPPVAMETVFNYLDPSDLARMAMTCRVWRTIVYRKSVWEKYNLSYSGPHLLHETVPVGARHIGAPTRACFINWLMQNTRGSLPHAITRAETPELFMKQAYAYWKRQRRPCLEHSHHNIYDMLRIPFPPSISKTDQRRILCRVVHVEASETLNAYAHYLARQRDGLGRARGIGAPILDEADKDSSDPLHRFRYASQLALAKQLTKVDGEWRAVRGVYDAASLSLKRRGFSEFTLNDVWYARDQTAAWSAAAFSYKKSSS